MLNVLFPYLTQGSCLEPTRHRGFIPVVLPNNLVSPFGLYFEKGDQPDLFDGEQMPGHLYGKVEVLGHKRARI